MSSHCSCTKGSRKRSCKVLERSKEPDLDLFRFLLLVLEVTGWFGPHW